ncbi:MAG: glycosyltransferase family 4 protein [Cellvibrionaceae bacterium]
MKLAFVLFRYFPFGGMQRNMMSIAKACHDRGHEIEIICSEWLDKFPSDLKVTRLGIHDNSAAKNNGAQMEIFFQAFSDYRKIHQYDLVIGFNKFPDLDVYYAADSCFATKAYEERTWLYRLTKRAKVYLQYEQAVFGAGSSTKILEVSNKEREQFQKHYKTSSERFITLPPGISRNRIAPAHSELLAFEKRKKLCEELGINTNQKILLAIGSGFRTKGLERSIHVIADLILTQTDIDPVLLVAGQDKADKFVRLAKKLKVLDHVKFLGGRDDVPELLQASDVVLHPAHKENTGNVLLEAMVAGRPVITTDVCGYAHYVKQANMGVVIDSTFSQKKYLESVKQVLSIDDNTWRDRGKLFSAQEEIYSRPEFVAGVLENLFSHKIPANASLSNNVKSGSSE